MMTNKDIDPEIDAIKTLLEVLSPLTPEIRKSVLSYVTQRLHISAPVAAADAAPSAPTAPSQALPGNENVHIKTLKETKQPKSANEMAALVAYFLSEVVPETSRKTSISLDDIRTYFKIGDFPLPKKPEFTLSNAKNAGYLDATGNGNFKLNPVGYNLIVHSLPKGASKSVARPRKTRKTRKKTRG